jgi:hypothetical protein
MIGTGAHAPVFETVGDFFKVTLFPIEITGRGGVDAGNHDVPGDWFKGPF